MLDIHQIRTDRDGVAAALSKRLEPAVVDAMLDDILRLDDERRELIREVDAGRAARNRAAREVDAARRSGSQIPVISQTTDISGPTARLKEVEQLLEDRMAEIPNLPSPEVPSGGKESNVVLRTWGRRPEIVSPTPHWDLAANLGLVDFTRGVRLSGSGFWMYRGVGAQLEWALINYFVNSNLAAGYTMLMPPHMVLPAAGRAAGQFPKFVDDVYQTTDPAGLFLIPTSETAIVGAYAGEVFKESQLPLKVFAYTPCYRRERAGTHSDERGTVRGHQFNKVEIFQFVEPEQSQEAFQQMVAHVESLVAGLGLHYRTSLLAAGDASASMRRTFDVEVWIPSISDFKEVSSVSWAGDYQARRANIRLARAGSGERSYIHTLNGSALATSRVLPAILEQCQMPDGSVTVPAVLRPFLGLDRIEPAKPILKNG